jgi:NitT/TauT family transport system permease protein
MGLKEFYRSHERLFLGVASLTVILVVWELIGHFEIVNPFFFAWPSTIIQAFIKIVTSGELIQHLSISFYELLVGFGLASITGIPIGVMMGRFKRLEYILDPVFSALSAMPRIALMPLIIIFFGIGTESKIFLVYLGCFFPILVNVFQGVKNVDQLRIDMGRVFGAKGLSLVNEIFIPSILPYMMVGFRVATSVGLIMVVVGEFFSGNKGIGYKIKYEAGFFRADAVMAWVLIISLLAILFAEINKYWEKRMSRWKPL